MDLDRIFKAYDVRGVVPTDLDVEAARRIGIGFARFAGAGRIAVGRDCRVSSPDLADALVAGITSQGVDVELLGEVTTDMTYFVAGAHDLPGVMITASHNPGEWNGLKFCLAGAAPVGEDSGLTEIKRVAADPPGPAETTGSVTHYDPGHDYVEHLFSIVDAGAIAPMRVAVDGGNGMAGVALPGVFDRIPVHLTGLYLDPDGTFPNHPADPLQPENLADLLTLMRQESFHLGIAFDGDADRAFFVDDQTVPLPGSTTTAIIARWFLAREPGASIVHNLICSRAVPEIITAAGGTPIRTRVGHSFIKEVMKDSGAIFGGEHSGHYYFAANYRADSGMLAMLVLLQVLSESGQKLSALRKEVEPYSASGEVNLRVEDRDGAIERAAEAFEDAETDRLDGLTVSWPDRWCKLRPSNTEPLVRLNISTVTMPGGHVFGAGWFGVQARYGDTLGEYPLLMPMSTEQATVGGRETFGEPKKIAKITSERDGDSIHNAVSRMGYTVAEIKGTIVGERDPEENERIDFYFKLLPSPEGPGMLDGDPYLVESHKHTRERKAELVDGEVILGESPLDPVADLPVRALRSITLCQRATIVEAHTVGTVPAADVIPYVHRRYDDLSVLGKRD